MVGATACLRLHCMELLLVQLPTLHQEQYLQSFINVWLQCFLSVTPYYNCGVSRIALMFNSYILYDCARTLRLPNCVAVRPVLHKSGGKVGQDLPPEHSRCSRIAQQHHLIFNCTVVQLLRHNFSAIPCATFCGCFKCNTGEDVMC